MDKDKKTILHLEDNEDDSILFKIRLKKSGLLDHYGIDLITVTNPKDAQEFLKTKHIDLVISDVRSDYASEKEVAEFLKAAHKKAKIMFYTNAEYEDLPKFENIVYIPKSPTRDYYRGDSVDLNTHNQNVFDKIKNALSSNKEQKISEEAISKMTRPDYHIATPLDKELALMLENFKSSGLEKQKIMQTLIEWKQLRVELQAIKSGNHSQKHMNDLMDKYTEVVKKLKEFKQKDGFAFKAIKPTKSKEVIVKTRETPRFKHRRTI